MIAQMIRTTEIMTRSRYPKASYSCIVHTWALAGLPYQNFGVHVFTHKARDRTAEIKSKDRLFRFATSCGRTWDYSGKSKGPSTNVRVSIYIRSCKVSFINNLNTIWAKYSLFEALDPLGRPYRRSIAILVRVVLLATSMSPYTFQRHLKYGPLRCKGSYTGFMVDLQGFRALGLYSETMCWMWSSPQPEEEEKPT